MITYADALQIQSGDKIPFQVTGDYICRNCGTRISGLEVVNLVATDEIMTSYLDGGDQVVVFRMFNIEDVACGCSDPAKEWVTDGITRNTSEVKVITTDYRVNRPVFDAPSGVMTSIMMKDLTCGACGWSAPKKGMVRYYAIPTDVVMWDKETGGNIRRLFVGLHTDEFEVCDHYKIALYMGW